MADRQRLRPGPRPPTPSSISTVTTQEEFRGLLDSLRNSLGLSYTQIGDRAGKGMSRSTAQAVITNDRLPRRDHVVLLLRACRVSTTEQTVWLDAWKRLNHSPAAPVPDDTAIATHPQNDVVVPGPASATEPVGSSGANRRLPVATLVRALAALTVTTLVISASAVTMWLLHVPVQVIITVYGLVTVCVAAWTAVARAWLSAALTHQQGDPTLRRVGSRRYGSAENNVVDPPLPASPPVIGED